MNDWILEYYHEYLSPGPWDQGPWHQIDVGMNLNDALLNLANEVAMPDGEYYDLEKRIFPHWRIRNEATGEIIPGEAL